MSITLHIGDCRMVLREFAEASIDACVTDPPYELKFMGKSWDGTGVAFQPETWCAVYRVLKPGGHLLAMGGTRTYHRLACAIEDAGFDIRDTISWLYGSGFPKSHDVSKGIDRRKDWSALPQLQQAIGTARRGLGISQSEAARRMGLIPADEDLGGGGFMWFETGMRMPTREQWPRLKAALGIGGEFDQCFEMAVREIIGTATKGNSPLPNNHDGHWSDGQRDGEFEITAPATNAARQWEGWGTALKPACELIVLARKPLSEGTVAANVLRWGTGAINVDGCRVEAIGYTNGGKNNSIAFGCDLEPQDRCDGSKGRWPANVVHDGSAEVTAAFPESGPASDKPRHNGEFKSEAKGYEYAHTTFGHADNGGSAARFFYTSKADSDDRLGSKHPTVKPLDLMQWLVRLVTPKGGTVLDPFAGTGTTGEAAFREGMRAVLIEAEPEYQADIRRRIALVLAGPDERARASIKAKNLPRDDGPLFADRETWADMWAKPFDFSQEPK